MPVQRVHWDPLLIHYPEGALLEQLASVSLLGFCPIL